MCLNLKSVKKKLVHLSLLGTMVFAAMSYGQNAANTPKKGDASVTNVKIDTLCAYGMIRWYSDVKPTIHFQNDAQLTTFLNMTGYFESEYEYAIAKKMTHKPDFKKWTYFAFVGPDIKHTVDISYGKDTVIITHIKLILTSIPSDHLSPTRPPSRILVYFIQSTEKPIKFVEVREPFSERNWEN